MARTGSSLRNNLAASCERVRCHRPPAVPTVMLCLLFTAGCGYTLVGKGSSLPDHIKNVAIQNFKNATYQHGLETILSDAVIEEFERHGSIALVKTEQEADAVLMGVIKHYEYKPLTDKNNQITEYKIAITAAVVFRDRVKNRNYWKDDDFYFMEDYFVTEQLSSSRDNQQAAWEEAAEDFASSLVSIIMEGF
ncbi:LptE family protein [bacterium]|nr:LptE family protein [candidate division CSSED10-310 bacterium]